MLAAVGSDVLRAVLQGAPPGTVYALVALGFVLAYKTSGIFNLAFGAQAYVSAIAFFTMRVEWGWATPVAFLCSVVLLAPLVGIVLEFLVFRHLRTAPPVSGLVVAIGLTVALPPLADIVFGFEPRGGQVPEGLAPNGNSVFYDVFGTYAFSRNELVAMGAALISVLALVAVFRFSALGLRMRAVVESPRMTELNGIDADRVSAGAWALSSFFAGLAGVLIAPRFNTLSDQEFLTIVVVAIAAAAIGSLTNLPRAFLGALGLGIGIALFNTFVPRWAESFEPLSVIQDNLTPAIPFVVLFVVLVFVPSIRRSRAASDPLSGVDPPPTAPVAVVVDRRRALLVRGLGIAAALAVGLVVFADADRVWLYLVTEAVVLSIVFLSFTVVTGYAGHISLAQGAFAATGAFTMFQLADRWEVSVLGGAVAGALLAAVVAAAVSLLTLRLNGIWIAIATLAFAFFFTSVVVKFSWAGGTRDGSTSQAVPRPVLGPWDLGDNRNFLVLSVIVLGLVYVAVSLFGRSDVGQRLRALRGSEVGAQSIGISPAAGRVIALALSGAIAGFGGAMVAIHQESVSYDQNFSPALAMLWLVLVVTFGVHRPLAAVLAAGAFTLFGKLLLEGELFSWVLRGPENLPEFFPLSPGWLLILFGLGTVQYAKHPEGVVDMVGHRLAERSARVAARKQAASSTPDDTDGGAAAAPVDAEVSAR